MSTTKRIFAFHLLNDRSGSPKVLSQLVKQWIDNGLNVSVYTQVSQDGFLSHIPNVHYINGWYIYKKNVWLRFVFFSISQLILLVTMWRSIKKEDIVYVNTVLPFGAAILGKLKQATVIYHIHESTVNPPILKWFLFSVVRCTAHKIINVSKYVEKSHGITSIPNVLHYNTIDDAFLEHVTDKSHTHSPRNILMICSLKTYKGVFEFLQLAKDFPLYDFQLVLNASQDELNSFFYKISLPDNLTCFPSQKDVHPFYRWADVIVNLSRPDGWIETFGLTIIEGMAYGLPAIVPPIGGILEVIEEGVTGFSVDARNRSKLNETLQKIMSNPSQYHDMAKAAKQRLALFVSKNQIPIL